ncbi:hypothetical protein FRB97_006100 [Tulasnella sp. 331]|nr:hypothetical protein FRB97_006100 [Tulasnella sp. 331]
MSQDDVPVPIPNLKAPQYFFVLSDSKLSHLHDEARKGLVKLIQDDEMAPYYASLPPMKPALLDATALSTIQASNSTNLENLDKALASAYDTEGESEISDALRARANYLTKIGDKEKSVEAQKLAMEKTPGLGARIDIVLTLVRIGFFFADQDIIKIYTKKAELLVEEGGDWDRRNRLKVYSGMQLLSIRQFERAANLFIDALPTFTASELLDYNDFVTLTVIAGTLVLKRVDLKKKIISSPEVNQVLPDIPSLANFTKSLYDSEYAKFFVSLAAMEQTQLLPSRLLSPHARYYVREMRILAYAQILESYRSLTLQSMSTAFGVGIDFIDNDLQKFISSGRLNCTIDKVHGIVETNRPSSKNAQYETVSPSTGPRDNGHLKVFTLQIHLCKMPWINGFETNDVRFETSLTGDGSDAMNFDCDYSAATVILYTDEDLRGHGMTFTIGRGTEVIAGNDGSGMICQVVAAIKQVAERLMGKETEKLFQDMGKTWDLLMGDAQLRWIGPEKGVIHLATAAVGNALWDMYARSRQKPLWKLIVDMTPEEFVRSTTFRYITDVIKPAEALEMLHKLESSKAERESRVRDIGRVLYPAYITSAGWLRYDDRKVAALTRAAIASGFTHFKMKVGANFEDDQRRARLIRSILDDPKSFPADYQPPPATTLEGKNAGPTGCVLMMDANQVWDVEEAIEYMKGLADAKPWQATSSTS